MSTKKEQSRRKFIKTAGKAAVVAPAAGVILSAASIPLEAQLGSSGSNFCVEDEIWDGQECRPD